MKVQINKRNDGAGVLRCIREDGSVTWQKQKDGVAPFFALHDLTHFAVETTLGFRNGFFGLIAQGWDIDDTTGKGSRGALPTETTDVEKLVGLFFTERAGATLWTAEEFNQSWNGPRSLTADEIVSVRKRCAELFHQWKGVSSGSMLELEFAAITRAPAEGSASSKYSGKPVRAGRSA